jgi:hypothetical protein
VTAEPKFAIALDVTVTAVSLARVIDGDPGAAKTKLIRCPSEAGAIHTLATTVHKHQAVVNNVLDAVTKRGTPAVVVMVKDQWASMQTDPSASRRAGLWWAIAAALVDAGIPVAELPLLTLQTWATGTSKPGREGITMLTDDVRQRFPGITDPGDGYRMTTVAAAAAGAMAARLETPYPVTQDRLNRMRGYSSATATRRSNQGVQWPAAVKPPATVAAWHAADTPEEQSA